MARARTTRSTPTTRSPKPTDYKNVVISYSNGAPVFVKNVANVVNGVENTQRRRPG